MSSHLVVYVGPFLRVPAVTVASARTVRRCSAGCGVPSVPGARFCCGCGAAIEARDKVVSAPGRLATSQLPVELEDDLFAPEHCTGSTAHESIWLSNRHDFGRSVSDYGRDSTASLRHVDIDSERAEFAARHQAVIEHLRVQHGVEPVVDWGMVAYHH